MRTQVGIVGAGPSGLLLARILGRAGIETVVVERQSRTYVEGRIRAGVLEQGTVDLLEEAEVGDRMRREGLVHDGVELCVHGRRHRIDFRDLADGKAVTVYGQTEITKDLNKALVDEGEADIRFEARDVAVDGFDGVESDIAPVIRFEHEGTAQRIECDFIAGCDGFHGVTRRSVPPLTLNTFERVYPFAWLGILAETPPVSDELIYANSPRGFALFSMRSTRISRLYIQCSPDEEIDEWPDERIWDELKARLDPDGAERLQPAPLMDKSITPMRSFVAEPMRFGRLFLAGDAAHIVPPTGAKGLNLAAADIRILSRALIAYYRENRSDLLDAYSDACLRRVWKAQRFSWWLTTLLHRFPEGSPFEHKVQLAELDWVTSARTGAKALAENYVGLPFDE